MRYAPRTILGQLIAGSLIVQVLVFGMFLSFSIRRELKQTQRRDRQRLANQTETLARVLEEPLAAGDRKTLDEILRVLPVSTTIRGVRITNAAGEPLHVSNGRISPALNARERALLPGVLAAPGYRGEIGGDGAEGVLPIVANGVVKGIVWVVPDTGVTHRYLVTALRNVLVYGALALIGNLLTVWALSATLVRPLRQLRRATNQVQHDPNDLSAFPLPIAAMNEAGELTASFNAMVSEIGLQRQGTQDTLSLLDAMLSSAPIGFAFYDRDLRYVRLNEHMARMHDVPADKHIGKRYRDLLPKSASTALADASESLLLQTFETARPISDHEMTGTLPGDTSPRTWQTSYFPVSVSGDEVRWVGVIAAEITERKRAEEAMRRTEKLATAGRLAASIAHEINNPLESVTNLLYLLRHHPSLDHTARDYATLAQQELARVAEITQETLRFHRQPTLPRDVHVPDVLRSVLVLHNGRLQSPRIDVQLRLSDDAILFGYAGELRQVFANLIGNAIDAMPAGGRLWLRACAARRHGKRGVKVTVADAGTGMLDAVRRRIFEPFFTTKEVTGTGLGLWVSAEILTKHQASVQVRSRTPKHRGDLSGTVFSLFFPCDGVPRGPVRMPLPTRMAHQHVM